MVTNDAASAQVEPAAESVDDIKLAAQLFMMTMIPWKATMRKRRRRKRSRGKSRYWVRNNHPQ